MVLVALAVVGQKETAIIGHSSLMVFKFNSTSTIFYYFLFCIFHHSDIREDRPLLYQDSTGKEGKIITSAPSMVVLGKTCELL